MIVIAATTKSGWVIISDICMEILMLKLIDLFKPNVACLITDKWKLEIKEIITVIVLHNTDVPYFIFCDTIIIFMSLLGFTTVYVLL